MRKRIAVVLVMMVILSGLAAGESAATPTDMHTHSGTCEAESAALDMPFGNDYTKLPFGVIAFRNNAFRQNGAVGKVPVDCDRMLILWERHIPLKSTEYLCGGFEWTGQPLIVQWSKEVRDKMAFREGYEPPVAMKEIIIANAAGVIRMLDPKTGEDIRGPLETGHMMSGSIALHPSGMPYLCAVRTNGGGEDAGLVHYNLYDLSEYPAVNRPADAGNTVAGGFVSAPLIDRITSRLIAGGADGSVYNIALNPEFDYANGLLAVTPEFGMARGGAAGWYEGFTSPVSAMGNYIYCTDMYGMLRCMNSGTMETVWEKDMEDTVTGAMPLEVREDRTVIYAANTLTQRKAGAAAVVCCDALTGDELWRREVDVEYSGTGLYPSGFTASPVVGFDQLDSLICCTVTGLTREGRDSLGLSGTPASAMIAMDKKTGEVLWAIPVKRTCISSPVAVYDENGAGKIIQGDLNGVVRMVDGLTGEVILKAQLSGRIEASPAVYNDLMVIAAWDDGNEYIYGLRLTDARGAEDGVIGYEPFAPFEAGD